MFKFFLVATALTACAHLSSCQYAQILSQRSNINEDGSYQYEYSTSDGISAQEAGVGGYNAAGNFAYYSPEGQLVQISYIADENGFQPQGDVLPTPPPIPPQILRSLEYIRTHPQYEEHQANYSPQQYRGRKF